MTMQPPDDENSSHEESMWINEMRDVRPLSSPSRYDGHAHVNAKEDLKQLRFNVKERQEVIRHRYEIPQLHHQSDITRIASLDENTLRRIRKEKMQIERTLDLHDMTLQTAYETFYRFIFRAYQDNVKVVLVITGKGSIKSGRDTIRSTLPKWCEIGECASVIIGIHHAHPKHGGNGAYYIRIKRYGR